MCSTLLPPEGAAPPNSSPKRGLTSMHSPSPPDPRWSRRIACVSPPPASVVCFHHHHHHPPCWKRVRGAATEAWLANAASRPPVLHEVGHGGSWRFSFFFPVTKCGTLYAASLMASSSHLRQGAEKKGCRSPPPHAGKPRAMHITRGQACNEARRK